MLRFSQIHVSVLPLSHNNISSVVLLHLLSCFVVFVTIIVFPSLPLSLSPQPHYSLFILFSSCLPVHAGPTAVCGGSAVTLSRVKKNLRSANSCFHSNQFAGRTDNPVECMEAPCRRTLQQEGEEGGTPDMIALFSHIARKENTFER